MKKILILLSILALVGCSKPTIYPAGTVSISVNGNCSQGGATIPSILIGEFSKISIMNIHQRESGFIYQLCIDGIKCNSDFEIEIKIDNDIKYHAVIDSDFSGCIEYELP